MLKIRLARHGRTKKPFYRVVLTEHTRPVQSGYTQVLGWFDPIAHKMEFQVNEIKAYIEKGAKPSERVAKLLYQATNDKFFAQYYEERTRVKITKKATE